MRDIDKKIIALYKAGNTQKEVADKLSITRDAVRYSLSKHNVKPYAKVICCKECGDEYKTIRRWTKFCSDYCRLKHNKRTTLQKERECEHCGMVFHSYKSRYCSDACREQPRPKHQLKLMLEARKLYLSSCSECGGWMARKRRGIKYCRECRADKIIEHRRAFEAKHQVDYDLKCKECGRWFRTTSSRRVFCRVRCGYKYNSRVGTMIRRERILLNGEVHWNISAERLIKRDKSICYLCGGRVDTNDFRVDEEGRSKRSLM